MPNENFHYFYTLDGEIQLSFMDPVRDFKENIQEITIEFKFKTYIYEITEMNVHKK